MCLHWDHICSNICMTRGYMHVSVALVCIYNGIQSVFDQHIITHSTLEWWDGEADNSRIIYICTWHSKS